MTGVQTCALPIWKHVDGAAAIVGALQEAFVLEIRDVFVHGSQRTEAETAGDFLVGRGIAVLLGEA